MMDMIKKLAIVTFLLVLLAFTMVERTWAQTLVPGVSKDNVFYYDFAVFWSSNDPNASVPESLIDLNRTEWLRIAITDIYDPMVYLNITYHFENETENNLDGFVNIETGESVNGNGLVIAPNLNANDLVYPSGNSSFTINETVTMTYPSGVRETNHFIASTTNLGEYAYVSDNVYFDRQTGVMVEWYTERSPLSNPNEKTTLHWKIKESNVWVVPEFPSVLILPLFMIATLLAVIVYGKKRTGHQVAGSTKIHKL
jgi:hypothetical protein